MIVTLEPKNRNEQGIDSMIVVSSLKPKRIILEGFSRQHRYGKFGFEI